MNNKIPYFPRLAVKIGITLLWSCLRFIEVLLGIITKWLKAKMNKPL
jgi:hypothetical protein